MKKDLETLKNIAAKRRKMHGSPLKKHTQHRIAIQTRSRSGKNQVTNVRRQQWPDPTLEKTRNTRRKQITSNNNKSTPIQPQSVPETVVDRSIIRTRSMKKTEQSPSNNRIRIILRKGETPRAIYPVQDHPIQEQQPTTKQEAQQYYTKLMSKQAQRFMSQRKWYEKKLAQKSQIQEELQKQIDELKMVIEKLSRQSRRMHN